MNENKLSNRALKKKVLGFLSMDDPARGLEEIRRFQPRRIIGPLFSHFYHKEELVRWRAVTAMGAVVSEMAETGNMEAARVVMRRFMWNLNDESGGIGWGSPEAMGEVTARNERLADEYHCILTSYAWEAGNYLEHEVLQRGLLWGIGRLAHARPGLIRYAIPYLLPFINSHDPIHRGLAVHALGPLADAPTKALIKPLTDDNAEIRIFLDGRMAERTVAALAEAALRYINPARS
ncbi:hypothetical protein DENIS_3685 [Desulfonema ishimotonii]|uniref:HEAT repeat domain-containing protein n=1 Tax=Desulfonema ishimotonii TaxID=45657 RepID=A0A401G0G4_9BACT|nr:DVU0298 family protein [Desulfonema ishimotonii]GBC62708.1 hypothetical protein DENIS_3685 [Desulfonema ishimotonii]